MAENLNLLEIREGQVGYGKDVLLSNLQLSVESGKIVTLIGPNGCGKSTLLKTITGQLAPMGGVISLLGEDMKSLRVTEIAKELSMVMTHRISPEYMTVREVVETGRYPYVGRFGILSPEDHKKVEEALQAVHASEVAEKEFTKISDGQRQRVMLARALCQEPQVLILDEPTSYLDMKYKLDILQSIRKMVKEKHIGVLMSLHEIDLCMQISDEVALVNGTGITQIASPEQLMESSAIADLFGVRESQFHGLSGMLQLSGAQGEPEGFVIGGGGSAIPLYRKLQRKQISFACGVLTGEDVEMPIALATASECVHMPAFYPVDEEALQQAKMWIEKTKWCICTVSSFGPNNERNRELMEYAKRLRKLIVQTDI